MKYFEHLNKNVFLLASAQVFSMTAMNINIITTGLAGFLIAPYGWLSTFPLSLQFIMTMISTFPCSMLMSKYGRKIIFLTGIISISLGGYLERDGLAGERLDEDLHACCSCRRARGRAE